MTTPIDFARLLPLGRAINGAAAKQAIANTVYRQASVVSVQSGPPPTLTINLAGTTVAEVPFYNGYTPTGGDLVDVLMIDGVMPMVLGAPSYRAPAYATQADFDTLSASVDSLLIAGRISALGRAVLGSAGVVDVVETAVTSTCEFFLSNRAIGGAIGTVGALTITGADVGVGFTVQSTNSADRSAISYKLVEPT